MFGILLRPLPILENVKIIDESFWQLMYVLLPEITYFLLVFYSVIKVFELKSYLLNKIISYFLITPNFLIALELMSNTPSNLSSFWNIVLN